MSIKKTKKTKKAFLYDPKNPKKTYSIFNNANPKDTIHIKYATLTNVRDTLKNLRKLYKDKKYSYKRIMQVVMIMRIRLEILCKTINDNNKFINIVKRLNEIKKFKI